MFEKIQLSNLNKPPTVAYQKGPGFQKEVAAQLKKFFRGLSPEIIMPARAKGINRSSSYDVDIHLTIKGKGLLANKCDVWVDGRWEDKSPVKKSEIQKLVIAAQDVFRYSREAGGYFYDALIIVSDQDFNKDALNYATSQDVFCLHFDEGQLIEKNTPWNWAGYPAWMKHEYN
jgi:hypothetical protein